MMRRVKNHTMKPVRVNADYYEMSPATLFKSLSTHTREPIVTDNFKAKDKLHQYPFKHELKLRL